jgi:tungstate transport system permease protein
VLLIFILPEGPLGSLRIEFTLKAMFVAQTILALPYIVALTAAAIQGLPPGVVDQARALGAGRIQLGVLALREAKVGVMAAVIATATSTISEVGAVVIVGGNVTNHTESLASALLAEFTFTPNDPRETATALILLAFVLVLVGTLTVLQQRTGQLRLRFRGS